MTLKKLKKLRKLGKLEKIDFWHAVDTFLENYFKMEVEERHEFQKEIKESASSVGTNFDALKYYISNELLGG